VPEKICGERGIENGVSGLRKSVDGPWTEPTLLKEGSTGSPAPMLCERATTRVTVTVVVPVVSVALRSNVSAPTSPSSGVPRNVRESDTIDSH
jgi:hypothetical protein